jgi:hypothetical protein
MDADARPALQAPSEPELIVEPVSGPGTEQLLLDDQLGVGGIGWVGLRGPAVPDPDQTAVLLSPTRGCSARRTSHCSIPT